MKKLFSTLFALAVIVSMTVLSSCGGVNNASVGKIIEKADNGEKLTEADYGTLIDYVDAAMDDMLPLYKEVQEAQESGNFDKLQDIQKKGEKLEAKYEHMEKALALIDRADDSDLGEANMEKGLKLIKKMSDAGLNLGLF